MAIGLSRNCRKHNLVNKPDTTSAAYPMTCSLFGRVIIVVIAYIGVDEFFRELIFWVVNKPVVYKVRR